MKDQKSGQIVIIIILRVERDKNLIETKHLE